MTQDLKSLIRDVIMPAFEKSDYETFYRYCDANIRFTWYGMTPEPYEAQGLDTIRKIMAGNPMDPASVKMTIEDILVDGDRAMCSSVTDGKLNDGTPYGNWAVDVYTFADGLITEVKSYIVPKKEGEGA